MKRWKESTEIWNKSHKSFFLLFFFFLLLKKMCAIHSVTCVQLIDCHVNRMLITPPRIEIPKKTKRKKKEKQKTTNQNKTIKRTNRYYHNYSIQRQTKFNHGNGYLYSKVHTTYIHYTWSAVPCSHTFVPLNIPTYVCTKY